MSLVITVHLRGQLSGPVTSKDKQEYSVNLSKGKTMKNIITHTNRKELDCVQKINISDEVLKTWNNNKCPSWEKPSQWKRMDKNRRINSYAMTYDEGRGVSIKSV